MAFEMTRVRDAFFPEVGGVAVGVGAQIGAAMVDEKTDWNRPVAQYIVTGGSALGSVLGLGFNRYTDFCKGLAIFTVGSAMANIARAYTQKALRKPVQSRAVDFAALVPQETVVLSKVLSSPSAQAQAKRLLGVGETTSVGSIASTGGNKHKTEDLIPSVEYE